LGRESGTGELIRAATHGQRVILAVVHLDRVAVVDRVSHVLVMDDAVPGWCRAGGAAAAGGRQNRRFLQLAVDVVAHLFRLDVLRLAFQFDLGPRFPAVLAERLCVRLLALCECRLALGQSERRAQRNQKRCSTKAGKSSDWFAWTISIPSR
jgi:hypothetical protein